MKSVKLTEALSVSPQISVDDLANIAAQGYDVVVNNRPDGEEPNQPASADIAAAAEAAGLQYYYLPITAQDFPGADFAQMEAVLGDPGQRVFAFCRTGTRCTNLWVASRSEAERAEAEEVARQRGFELAMAHKFIGGHPE